MCVMSLTCWKAIGSPSLNESQNTLKAFNGSGFKPYNVLPLFPITLEGKTVQVEVEVFDAPLITIFCLATAGSILCTQLCRPFFVWYISHIKGR
jgi:hypothetical protein